MRDNLIKELKNLAQQILLLNEDSKVDKLYKKVQEVYEKLAVLDYLDKNSILHDSTSTNNKANSSESISYENELDLSFQEEDQNVPNRETDFEKEVSIDDLSPEEVSIKEESIPEKEELKKEQIVLDDLFEPTFDSIKDDFSQKEEFKDTVSLDETQNLFSTKKEELRQLSLNDRLLGARIQIGLNDRIAFVNNLFNFSHAEFNKVLTILNAKENETEARNYIHNTLKREYDWKGKEEIEERFIFLVERKFL